MYIDFKVKKLTGSVVYNENGKSIECHLDLPNVLYLLKNNPKNRKLKIMYSILSSGFEYGTVTDNYVIIGKKTIKLSDITKNNLTERLEGMYKGERVEITQSGMDYIVTINGIPKLTAGIEGVKALLRNC